MKTFNRDKIQRMVGRGTGGGGGGGRGVDLAGYASQAWVEQNYVSKAFFSRLFTALDADGEAVEPNDEETAISNIQAMFGLWTEQYLSALGLNPESGGGGGGGDVLAEPLVSINGIGSPTAANKTLVWNGTQWTFQPYGQGGGSVTSIRITVPTGFAVSPSTAITTAGTFAITFASGYSLPTTAKQTNWDTAYTWVNTNGASTVSKTAWGRTYWSAGAPVSISGDIDNAANIKIDNNKKVSWKKSGATNYLSMLTLDASNNFIVGESMANEGLATYVRGRSINFQTGTGSSGNHAASMSEAGLFTVEKLRIGSIVISEDTQNGGLHVENAGLYADNYISALGANSSSSGGVGDVTRSPLASSSDIRKKNVVSFVDVDIEQIAKMPVFNFTWKDGKQGTYLGTSAQEIQKLFPAAVSTMKDGYLAMDYGATALAAAVLTARKVVNHEERIRQLERENEELRNLLNIA